MILNIINECQSTELSLFLSFIKQFMNIIQIAVPILLLIMISIHIAKLVVKPDDKKLLRKIRNTIIAALIVFFVPMIINILMANVSNDNSFSSCWNESKLENYKTPSYMEPYDTKDKSSVYTNPDEYQKGVPKPKEDKSTTGSENDSYDVGDSGLNTTPGEISGDLQVHFIDPDSRVDAIYIKSGEESIFIDGGFKSDGKREIAYLDKIGVTKIDYYIGTHSHKDHVEAAPAVIAKYGIKKVLVGRDTADGSGGDPSSWYAIKIFAKEQNVSLNGVSMTVVKPGDVFYVGGLKISCIGPIKVTNGLSRGDTKQNYNSLILRMDYGTTSFLFTGDNSSSSNHKDTEANYPGMLNVDVLKNPHHNGCSSDNSYKLFNAEYVVFTTKKNSLPSNSCINKIKKYGAKYFFVVATGQSDNVIITSDGTNIKAYDHV